MDSSILQSSRRAILATAAAGAAGFAMRRALGGYAFAAAQAGSPSGKILTFNDIPGAGNIKVLNYALALETLEADLYQQAHMRLTNGGQTSANKNLQGLNLGDSEPDVRYVKMFGLIERQHRDFLRTELKTRSSRGQYDFGIDSMDRRQVMDLLRQVEFTGARAWLGAIKFFADKTYVPVAAGIQGTEARHAATITFINNGLFKETNSPAPTAVQNHGIEQPLEPDAVLGAVSKWIVAWAP